MSFEKQVWETFRAIDVKPMAEKVGKADYVTWSKVWALIMEHYPQSFYSFDNERRIQTGEGETVEVNCQLTIVENATNPRKITRHMHLPVMQSMGQFAAIVNPSARDISDARMRCLVKAAAMFGLGLSLWHGEDMQAHEEHDKQTRRILEFAKLKSDYRMDLWETAKIIKYAYRADTSGDAQYVDGNEVTPEAACSIALEAWMERNDEEKQHLWTAETKGGFFTQAEKEWIHGLRMTSSEDVA